MNRPRIRRVAPLVALLTLAACGDDDDTVDTNTTPETTESTETTASTDDTEDTDDTDDTDNTDRTTSTERTGTGSASAVEAEYVAAAADAIDFADPDVSECLAQALVDGIGMDRIEESGLSPEEFVNAESLAEIDLAVDAADAADVQEAMVDCGEIVEAYLDDDDITEGEAECARAEMTDELLAEWLVTGISELPPSPELEAMIEAVTACDTE
jgi:hypothetical protein